MFGKKQMPDKILALFTFFGLILCVPFLTGIYYTIITKTIEPTMLSTILGIIGLVIVSIGGFKLINRLERQEVES